jgi:hypothetical protein
MIHIKNSKGGTTEFLGLTNSCQVVFSLPMHHAASRMVRIQCASVTFIPMLNTSPGMAICCLPHRFWCSNERSLW